MSGATFTNNFKRTIDWHSSMKTAKYNQHNGSLALIQHSHLVGYYLNDMSKPALTIDT